MTTPRSKLVLSARCAGMCYPREADACLDYFRGFFSQAEGDGLAPWEPDAEAALPSPRIVLTPHIDFRVSGAAYGHAFAPWARRPATADVYVILGVGHKAGLPWSLDGRDYATPLGTVPSAAEEILDVVARCPGLPLAEAAAHVGEHSIEFPLVLLQALRRLRGIDRPFSFVPVLCGGMFPEVHAGKAPAPGSSADRLAEALGAVIGRLGAGRTVQVIVSIDGCHIGPRFDHPYRVGPQRLKDCAAWEEVLWQTVEAGDLDAFFAHLGADQNARYFDGVGALTLMMKLFPGLKLDRTHYEQWHTPSDASAVTFTSGWAA